MTSIDRNGPKWAKSKVEKMFMVAQVVCVHCGAINFFRDEWDEDLSKVDIDGITCHNCEKDSYLITNDDETAPYESEAINIATGWGMLLFEEKECPSQQS